MSNGHDRPEGTRREPPRRIKKKRAKFRKLAWRVSALAALAVLVICIGCWFAGKILRPLRLFSSEDRETQRAAAQYKAWKTENADLQRQIDYLKSQQGMTQAARKLGYVKPGEITLVIPEPDRSAPPQENR